MDDHIIIGLPYEIWRVILDDIELAMLTDEMCEECAIDSKMAYDMIQTVLDKTVKPKKDWVDELDERLRNEEA
jgi:hypothetical protein